MSGFILSYSYLDRSGRVTASRREFWIGRFARIYPAYLFAFLLAAPFQIWGSLHVNSLAMAAAKLSFGGLLVLSMVQAWTPWTVWYWNSPAWSLSVEVFFYFCFPFVAVWAGRIAPRRCLPVAICVWLIGLLAPAVYCAMYPATNQPPFALGQISIEMNPLLRLPEFLAGVLIGRLYVAGYRVPRRYAGLAALAAAGGMLLVLGLRSYIPRPLLADGLLLPFSGLLLFSLAQETGLLARFFSLPVMKTLGEASYSIYILQIPVSYALAITREGFSGGRFVLYLLTLLGLSLFTLRYIEQPMRLKLKRRFLPKQPRVRMPSPAPQEALGGAAAYGGSVSA